MKKNLNIDQAITLSDIYAWQIDFFRIQPGDSFKVYSENIYVDDQLAGTSRILTAQLFKRVIESNAFYFEDVTSRITTTKKVKVKKNISESIS
ncbi:hypothetical protein [Melioribacter sp. OK-6-Me]|uniref:hypothetical protein n=1 Tax=unclassified Melioribacter TaxID=2627329 RepID=UPI003ED84D90